MTFVKKRGERKGMLNCAAVKISPHSLTNRAMGPEPAILVPDRQA